MSELPPDPPRARRITAKTVTVRPADVTPDPSDEPTGPPKVLFWFRLWCAFVAFAALVYVAVLGALLYSPSWDSKLRAMLVLIVIFAAYSLPLWWRRPKRWHWVYGMALLAPWLLPPVTPIGTLLMVFLCQRRVVRYFRNPPVNNPAARPAEPPDAPAPTTDPPTVLFALRWMCLIGCGVCLLGVPVTAVLFAADPDAGWGVMGWLGGFAGAFALFAVPLFARTPRPWVWWYGLGLLVLCALSLYFTVLAVPILVFWLMKGVRGHFLCSPRAPTEPVV
jgi:hypothetical protein